MYGRIYGKSFDSTGEENMSPHANSRDIVLLVLALLIVVFFVAVGNTLAQDEAQEKKDARAKKPLRQLTLKQELDRIEFGMAFRREDDAATARIAARLVAEERKNGLWGGSYQEQQVHERARRLYAASKQARPITNVKLALPDDDRTGPGYKLQDRIERNSIYYYFLPRSTASTENYFRDWAGRIDRRERQPDDD